ncbi:hypothetical protein TNCV_441001 [Trichonephila clavipes]|nr:hypothetical protein TNCV_441001 [Trichonephila clavipes]
MEYTLTTGNHIEMYGGKRFSEAILTPQDTGRTRHDENTGHVQNFSNSGHDMCKKFHITLVRIYYLHLATGRTRQTRFGAGQLYRKKDLATRVETSPNEERKESGGAQNVVEKKGNGTMDYNLGSF